MAKAQYVYFTEITRLYYYFASAPKTINIFQPEEDHELAVPMLTFPSYMKLKIMQLRRVEISTIKSYKVEMNTVPYSCGGVVFRLDLHVVLFSMYRSFSQ